MKCYNSHVVRSFFNKQGSTMYHAIAYDLAVHAPRVWGTGKTKSLAKENCQSALKEYLANNLRWQYQPNFEITVQRMAEENPSFPNDSGGRIF